MDRFDVWMDLYIDGCSVTEAAVRMDTTYAYAKDMLKLVRRRVRAVGVGTVLGQRHVMKPYQSKKEDYL